MDTDIRVISIEKLGQLKELAFESEYEGSLEGFFNKVFMNGWSMPDWYGQGPARFELESDNIDWYYDRWFDS